MEVKILCACGSKYAFEVEPVNGRVPCELRCPKCNANWTDMANAQIAQRMPQPVAAPEPMPPAAVRMVSAGPASAPPAPAPLGLRITKAHAPSAEASGEAPAAPPSPRPAPLITNLMSSPVKEESSYARFLLGIGGALIGAAMGAAVYFTVFKFTDKKIKLLAIGVGFLGGLGARLLGREGSKELGAITGALVLVAIFGTQYMMAKSKVDDVLDPAAFYEVQVKYAKEVVKAVPNGTEAEIRAYLAKEEYEDTPAAEIPEIDVKELKRELPRLREMAEGKITKEQYVERMFDGTEIYEERLEYAKEALAAIPTGSEKEIRAFLVKQYAEEGEKVKPEAIEAEEVAAMKEELTELRDLVNGKITKERYAFKKEGAEGGSSEGDEDEEFQGSGAYNILLLAMSLSWFNVVCMVAGVGLAYRMSTDA